MDLQTILEGYEDYPHHHNSYTWWRLFKDYSVLPFPGAWLDQPQWWLDDVRYFDLLEERATLPHLIASASRNYNDAQLAMMKGKRA